MTEPLNVEELDWLRKDIENYTDDDGYDFQGDYAEPRRLLATIADRDKTIAALRSEVRRAHNTMNYGKECYCDMCKLEKYHA